MRIVVVGGSGRVGSELVRILGARVTHVWTDDPADAPKIAAASKIENVVAKPEDVIGQVDAVIIGTDDGHEHVRRAKVFLKPACPCLWTSHWRSMCRT